MWILERFFLFLSFKQYFVFFFFNFVFGFVLKDKTQMTMLIMWLIELYLNDLGGLKEENAKLKYEGLQEEFRKFLAQTKVKVGEKSI